MSREREKKRDYKQKIRSVVVGDCGVDGFVGRVVGLFVFAWPVFAVVVCGVARVSGVSGGRVSGRIGVRVGRRVSGVRVRIGGR